MLEQRGDGRRTILFDNLDDPYQLTNLAVARPDVVQALTAEVNSWLIKTHDPWKSV